MGQCYLHCLLMKFNRKCVVLKRNFYLCEYLSLNLIYVKGNIWNGLKWSIPTYSVHVGVGMFDTLPYSIQYLNFAKKWFIQYSIQYCLSKIQFKENSADSIQKVIQFNSQGIIDTGQIGKVPKNCPKSV